MRKNRILRTIQPQPWPWFLIKSTSKIVLLIILMVISKSGEVYAETGKFLLNNF